MKKTFLIVWGKTYSTGVIPSEYSRYLRLLWMSYFRIGNSIFTWNRPRETILEKLQEWIWCSVSIQSSIFPFYFFALPLNRRRIYFLGGASEEIGLSFAFVSHGTGINRLMCNKFLASYLRDRAKESAPYLFLEYFHRFFKKLYPKGFREPLLPKVLCLGHSGGTCESHAFI